MLGAQGTDPSELHSGSRPHPGRRQSQYSWAHMDPSAHSLAFRGGAEVPRPVYEWPTGIGDRYTDEEGCYATSKSELSMWSTRNMEAKCSFKDG